MNNPALLSLAVTQLWQLTLLIVIAAIFARAFCRNRPHLAMMLWLLVLVKCVTPPVLAAPFGLFCRTAEPEMAMAQTNSKAGPFAFFMKAEPAPPLLEPQISYSYPVEPATAEPEPVRRTARDWLAIAWGTGATMVIVISLLRVTICLRRIRNNTIETPQGLDDRLQQLRKRLGIRRRVSLVITTCALGPAIVGLFRLRVILPEVIASDETDSLEPILAHELIHVRRRDLWVGLLNLCARGLWWFHPLIWWVSRQINRDTERACDEEVLSALNCRPRDYARSLLRVLEQKNSLKAMPAFPGVRPVEITSQRMERIMSLRQGSRSGGSWRRKAIFVLAAAITLPGAVVSQDTDASVEPKPAEEPQQQVLVKATILEGPVGDIQKLFGPPEPTDPDVLFVNPTKETQLPKAETTPGGSRTQLGVLQELKVDPRVIKTSGVQTTVSTLDTKPYTSLSPSLRFRSLSARQLPEKVRVARKSNTINLLCAPKLICVAGQQASIQTVDAREIALTVTPTVEATGVMLKYELTLKEGGRNGETITRRTDVQACVRAGYVVVQTGLSQNDRDTVLLLEASELKPIPEAKLAPRAFVDHGAVAAKSALEVPVPAKPPSIVRIEAIVAEANDRPLVFPSPVPSSQIDVLIDRGNSKKASEKAQTYSIPSGQEARLVKQLAESHNIQVLSRPQVLTLIGQEASVEVEQNRNGSNAFHGLKLSLSPSQGDSGVVVSGKLSIRNGKEDASTSYEFDDLRLAANKTTLVRLDRPAPQPDVLIAIGASIVPQEPPRIRVEVVGAVQKPGVYEFAEGASLLEAIAQAGGFSSNAGMRLHVEANGLGAQPKQIRLMANQKPDRMVQVASLIHDPSVPRLIANDRVVVHRDDTRIPSANRPINTETRIYPVADLVVPIAKHSPSGESPLLETREAAAELRARIRALNPSQWDVAGGSSRIQFNETRLAIVVRASHRTHAEIQRLLKKLRRQRPGQIVVHAALYVDSDKKRLHVTQPEIRKPAAQNMSIVAGSIKVSGARLMAPKLLLFSGQQGEVKTGRIALKIRAKLEGQNIITTAVLGNQTKAWVIPNGHSAFTDVTNAMQKILGDEATGKRYGLWIKVARIEEAEEAELVLDQQVGKAAPPKQTPIMMMVTPDIVIQEEEEQLYLKDDLQYFPTGPEFRVQRSRTQNQPRSNDEAPTSSPRR